MKRGVVQHPKFEGLQRAIQEPKRSVVGMLELLWHATEMYHDDGGIGRWSDVNIAGAMDWHGGDARQLISTLIDVGWLDKVNDPTVRLVVHDWLSHAPNHVWSRVKKRVERAIAAGQNVPDWLRGQYDRAKLERNKDQEPQLDARNEYGAAGRERSVRPRPAASDPNPRPKTIKSSNLKLDDGAAAATNALTTTPIRLDAGVLQFQCKDGSWDLTADHLERLQKQFTTTRVLDCLTALKDRQIDEPDKLRTIEQMPAFLRNWLKTEERDMHEFGVSTLGTASLGLPRSSAKDRTLKMLEAR